MVSYAFAPSIGGVETASQILAEELYRRGHEVVVATATRSDWSAKFAFPVYYRPSPLQLLTLHRWADTVLHNSISLRFAWPLLAIRRPWMIVHTGFRSHNAMHSLAMRIARNVSVSQVLADHLGVPASVVPNAYQSNLFRRIGASPRPFAFGFLGRLVSDKGAHHLIEALAKLCDDRHLLRLAIIGGGPEEERLRLQVKASGLDCHVHFLGAQRGEELVQVLNDIDCLVVPTVIPEGFGIVALEGIACGCVVIGSQGGGLKEAIGPCGLTYPNGDVAALAAAMRRVLEEPGLADRLRAQAPAHLARHTPQAVVDAYLQVIDQALAGRTVHGRPPLG
ncbi:MAG: glycosyltransferase family 4 protein [Reyranellaceae bacterium]